MAKGRRIPSVMKHMFSAVPSTSLRRSSFDRSSGLKTTFDMDYLIPIYVDEVLPGDTFSLSETHLCRLTTLVQPLMDNIMLSTQWFFVPNRLLWDSWEDFITGGDEPDAWLNENPNNALVLPQVTSPEMGGEGADKTKGGYPVQSIYDYFGLPTQVPGFKHSVLPLRAYNLIWNEYYRDENLQDPIPVFTGDEDELVPDPDEDDGEPKIPYVYTLQRRNKRYDYFTSALVSQQKGPAVGIGITGGDSGKLPVQGLALQQYAANSVGYGAAVFNTPLPKFVTNTENIGTVPLDKADQSSPSSSDQLTPAYYTPKGVMKPGFCDNGSSSPRPVQAGDFVLRGSPVAYWSGTPVAHQWQGSSTNTNYTTNPLGAENWPIYVDLGSASSVTINSLRNAITLQHWFEKNARYGTRYVEFLQGHFGVHAGDYRLQRPEYLGGSKTYISVNPVVQNSATEKSTGAAQTPQGNLAAYALSSKSKKLFTKSFVEHGLIIGLVSLTADLTYQQGLDRSPWIRSSRYDFYFPTFAHLGEQTILNKEIYCQSDTVQDSTLQIPQNEAPFGYQERYAEYRYKPSKITGKFRSTAADTLDSWHLSQKFDNLPTLSSQFIESNTPIERALAVKDQPDVLADFFFSCRCVRPMPVYSVPGLRRI